MKKLLVLTLIMGLFAGASAQVKVPKKPLPVSINSPIKVHYQKKLFIDLHKKDGANISHLGTDYTVFKSNGDYEQNWGGVAQNGTWSYNSASNSITVNVNGTHTYTIKEVTATKIYLIRSNEELTVVRRDVEDSGSDSGGKVSPSKTR